MKRTSDVPRQAKRKRTTSDDEETATDGLHQGVATATVDSQQRDLGSDNAAAMFWYSDNITAACNATNAESSRQNIMSEEEKREKRLLSNRLSARRSRERHKVEVAHLEDQSRQLSQLVETLQNENGTLRELVDKQKEQNIQQQIQSRTSLVDLATLLEQPLPASSAARMDMLNRSQRMLEQSQRLQSLARSSLQLNPLFDQLRTPVAAPTQASALSLPMNQLMTGPAIPPSIRHLLDADSPWGTSNAGAKRKSRPSVKSRNSSSSDDEN